MHNPFALRRNNDVSMSEKACQSGFFVASRQFAWSEQSALSFHCFFCVYSNDEGSSLTWPRSFLASSICFDLAAKFCSFVWLVEGELLLLLFWLSLDGQFEILVGSLICLRVHQSALNRDEWATRVPSTAIES